MEEELSAFVDRCGDEMQLIDVGANYGIFSLVCMAWSRSRAMLIEPFPACVRMLRALQRMNRFSTDRFIIVPVAVGAEDGRLPVAECDGASFVATVKSETTVTMRSLDSLCKESGFRPTHIKIDVEGYELAVLNGALGILRQYKPVIQLEIHNVFLLQKGISPATVEELMRDFGYREVWSSKEYSSNGITFITRTVWA